MSSRTIKEKTVYRLLAATLFVDAINGFFITTFNSQFSFIGMIYRFIIIVYFLFTYCTGSIKNICKVGELLIFFSFSIGTSYFLYHKSFNGFIFDLIEMTRISLSIIISAALIYMLKRNIIKREILIEFIYSSVKIIFWIYVFCIITRLGKSTYGDVGYKAIFNANNGLNITLIVLLIFQVEKTIKTKVLKDIIYSIFLVVALVLLGAKSSFIFIAFYGVMKLILSGSFINLIKYIVIFGLATIISYSILFRFFEAQILDIIQRQMFFFIRESDSIITFFLSGRDIFLNAAFENYKINFSIFNIIWGIGSYFNQLETARILGIYSFKGTEMDLFDIFFAYGLFGMVITYFNYLNIFIKNYRILILKNRYAEIISFLSIIIFSITGGHVFTDAMASTYMAVVVALLVCNNKS